MHFIKVLSDICCHVEYPGSNVQATFLKHRCMEHFKKEKYNCETEEVEETGCFCEGMEQIINSGYILPAAFMRL